MNFLNRELSYADHRCVRVTYVHPDVPASGKRRMVAVCCFFPVTLSTETSQEGFYLILYLSNSQSCKEMEDTNYIVKWNISCYSTVWLIWEENERWQLGLFSSLDSNGSKTKALDWKPLPRLLYQRCSDSFSVLETSAPQLCVMDTQDPGKGQAVLWLFVNININRAQQGKERVSCLAVWAAF